jgi:ribosomal protein L22
MEKRLRELHREVLDAIRDGKLDSVFDNRDAPETLAAVKELDLEWVNASSVHASGALTMRIRVTDGGATVEGARLTLRFVRPDAAPYYAQVLTDAKGNAEMNVQVDEKALSDSSVLVQASFAGRTATRKFQLRAAI